MNSKQRRQDRRKWQYHVLVSPETRYANGYDTMWDWCLKNFGNSKKQKHHWREKWGHIGTHWQFTSAESAVLFTLTWS